MSRKRNKYVTYNFDTPEIVKDRSGRNEYYKLYTRFRNMHERCEDPTNKAYKNYGGRGIRVCDEWNVYENYKDWMLLQGYDYSAPFGKQTIDRIDVNGNYEPDNCRLVNFKVQDNNRRSNTYIEYGGEIHTISEWSDISGIPQSALAQRYKKFGDNSDKLFDELEYHSKTPIIDFKGEKLTTGEIAKRYGLSQGVVKQRYNSGLRDDGLVKPNNHKKSEPIMFHGKLRYPIDISLEYGLDRHTVLRRYKLGYREDDLVKKPVARTTWFRGKERKFSEIGKMCNIPRQTITARYNRGLRGEDLVDGSKK